MSYPQHPSPAGGAFAAASPSVIRSQSLPSVPSQPQMIPGMGMQQPHFPPQQQHHPMPGHPNLHRPIASLPSHARHMQPPQTPSARPLMPGGRLRHSSILVPRGCPTHRLIRAHPSSGPNWWATATKRPISCPAPATASSYRSSRVCPSRSTGRSPAWSTSPPTIAIQRHASSPWTASPASPTPSSPTCAESTLLSQVSPPRDGQHPTSSNPQTPSTWVSALPATRPLGHHELLAFTGSRQ